MESVKYTSFFAWIFGLNTSNSNCNDSLTRRIFRIVIIIVCVISSLFHGVYCLTQSESYLFLSISFGKSISFAAMAYMYFYGSRTLANLKSQFTYLINQLPCKFIDQIKRADIFQTFFTVNYIILSIVCNVIIYYEYITKKRLAQLIQLPNGEYSSSKTSTIKLIDGVTTQFLQISIVLMLQFYTIVIYSVKQFADYCNEFNNRIETMYFGEKDTKYFKLFSEDVNTFKVDSLIDMRKYMSLYNSIVGTINDDLSFIALFIFALEFHCCTSGLAFYFIHLAPLSSYYGFVVVGYIIITTTFAVVQLIFISESSIRSMTHARLIASRIVSSVHSSIWEEMKHAQNSLATFLSTNPLNVLTAWNLFEIRAQTGLQFVNSVVPFTVMTINTWRELRIIWGDLKGSNGTTSRV